MRIFRLGNRFVEQLEGMPIGGPHSFAMLHASLTRLEDRFISKLGCEKWLTSGGPIGTSNAGRYQLDQVVLLKRYVDDVAALSFCVCQGCLRNLIPRINRPIITFDENTESEEFPGVLPVMFWMLGVVFGTRLRHRL